MPITTAVQRGGFVYIYDEDNHPTHAIPAGNAPGDGLQGCTGVSVSVRRAGFVYVYDEDGRNVSAIPAQ